MLNHKQQRHFPKPFVCSLTKKHTKDVSTPGCIKVAVSGARRRRPIRIAGRRPEFPGPARWRPCPQFRAAPDPARARPAHARRGPLGSSLTQGPRVPQPPRAPCAQAPVTTWEPSGWAPAPMSPPARAWQSGKPGIGISRRRGKRWRRKAVARQQRPREEVTSNSPGLSGTQHRLSACVARTTAQTEGSDVTSVGVGSSVP